MFRTPFRGCARHRQSFGWSGVCSDGLYRSTLCIDTEKRMSRIMRNMCALAVLMVIVVVAHPANAQIAKGNLVVLRVGDGTTLATTGNGFSLVELTTVGTTVQTIVIPATGASSGLQIEGTTPAEGGLSVSGDGTKLVFAGYSTPFTSTGSLNSRSSAQAPRAYATVDLATSNYTFGATFAGTGTDYTTANIRSATIAGGNVYGAGNKQGTVLTGSTPTVIQASNIGTRIVQSIGGDLYYSAASGTVGIYKIAGSPTTATTPTAFITGVIGQGSNAYGFAISPGALSSSSVAYVADSTLGIQKFTYNGTVWSLAYNITTAAGTTGLGVDFSGANPIIYANNPSNIYKFTDTGSAGAATSIASTSGMNAFRGLAFITPVPEPTTVLAISAATVALVGAVRRRWRGEPVLA